MAKVYRVNEEIRAKQARLIDVNGGQIGIVSLKEALEIAKNKELDLVEVSPQSNPPVCRLMDYGKFKYTQSKKDKEVRKKQKIMELKEVKLRPKIDEHDFAVKSRLVQRLLKEGDKVKVTIMFRGREVTYASIAGEKILNRIAEQAEAISSVERKPKLEEKNMFMILSPKIG